jgi:uncharacterized protein
MEIEFDPAKRMSNLRKHGLDFMDASRLFDGLYLEMEDDREDYGEERWVAIGMIFGAVAVCVWSPRNEDKVRRIISLRKADDDETRDYFEAI